MMKNRILVWVLIIGVATGIIASISLYGRLTNLRFNFLKARTAFVSEKKTLQQTIVNLGNKVKGLESTLKRVMSTKNKVQQIQPQLVEWVYRHSKISKTMAIQIVDSAAETAYPLFLLALIKTESNFNPTAVSKAGALGLGQIMPMHKNALKKAGVLTEMREIFDIPTAMKATELIWDWQMTASKGDVSKALTLYLGAKNDKYTNRILRDYFYLNYLSKKPHESKQIPGEKR